MQADNPAALPCNDKERGPVHNWIRRADGTAYCTNCGVQLDAVQTLEAFPADTQINKKAGGANLPKRDAKPSPPATG